jgi:dihydrofolate synthase/folylpolyglutamate synthase
MTYPEALGYLSGLQRFGMRPGLETTRRLAAAVGDPQLALRFIHVAGTNGKGSTCAYLASMYREAGWRVGMYTSPHLVTFRERLQCDGEKVGEAAVARWVGITREAAEGLGLAPTFFEAVTVTALQWFRECRCDLVVWETGMGGRWDATNIVMPEASVITHIGFDHQQWLGNTLALIAGEKAGILKPGVPAVTGVKEPEALEVIREEAARVGAPLREVGPESPERERLARLALRLPLAGQHQEANAAVALATVEVLADRWPVGEAKAARGLEKACWPGRFDRRQRGATTWVLDGAHNASAFKVLGQALAGEYPGRRYALVLGMLADKDPGGVVEWLLPGAGRVLVVPVSTARGASPEALARMCGEGAPGLRVGVAGSAWEAMEQLEREGETLVVLAGSLYLVGEVLEALEGGTNSERALNEWRPSP